MPIAFLLAGLVLLALAGDGLVRGSVAAATRLHIPPIIIGLTIVAFGTSAPELVVSIEAALKGAPGLAVGNVVGSNIANILLVLGLPAMFAPLMLTDNGVRRSAFYMLGASIVLALFIRDGMLDRVESLFLFAGLVVYLVYSGIVASKRRAEVQQELDEEFSGASGLSWTQTILMIVFGIAGLAIGGKLTTDGALGLADALGVGDAAVGLTIVALGTSLPELATSLAAARRRETGVVIGNVIGSNIFNSLGILGITGMLVPLSVSSTIVNFDSLVMLIVTLAIVALTLVWRQINIWIGSLMVILYLGYNVMVFSNGMAG